MLTADDIRAVPLFVSLPCEQLDHIEQTAADIHLSAGEFAVAEGGEAALFAVLSGKIEVIKTVDGIERRLGWRLPGSIIGEVPLALGMPFAGSFRATEPTRVMRVEAAQYYALVASSRDFAEKMGALARERLGGLQALAAEPHRPRLTIVAPRWDAVCADLRRFLERNQVSFEWLTIEGAQGPSQWSDAPPTPEQCPAVRFADGAILHAPSAREVARRSACRRRRIRPSMTRW